MSRPYRLVVFDWEGTLGDTSGQVLSALKEAASRLNLGEIDEVLVRQYASLGLNRAIQKLLPSLSVHQHEQLLAFVQQSLITNSAAVYLFPGAEAILQKISQSGKLLAIATNKGQASLQRALQSSGLAPFFSVTRSAGQVPAKPCPQMLEEIMDECCVDAAETLMVGDSVSDIEMATCLKVDAVGIDFYHQADAQLRLAGALDVFDDYQELARYLEVAL